MPRWNHQASIRWPIHRSALRQVADDIVVEIEIQPRETLRVRFHDRLSLTLSLCLSLPRGKSDFSSDSTWHEASVDRTSNNSFWQIVYATGWTVRIFKALRAQFWHRPRDKQFVHLVFREFLRNRCDTIATYSIMTRCTRLHFTRPAWPTFSEFFFFFDSIASISNLKISLQTIVADFIHLQELPV